jgi:hypothetical protein
MKNKMFLTALCGIAIAMFASSTYAADPMASLKEGTGSRSGSSEGVRFGITPEQNKVSGATFALVSNIDNEVSAFEFAFLLNVAEKSSSGFQWGWLWGNYVNSGDFGGVQWGLCHNRVGKNMTGWQSAAGFNLVNGDMCGLQTAWLHNCVEGNLTGVQMAWVNKVDKTMTGVQFGLVNLAKDTNGVQWGFYNQTENLYGIQFGLVNRLVNYDKWPFTVILRAVF